VLLEDTSHATEAAQHDMAPTTTLDALPTPIPRAGHSRPGTRLPRSMVVDATTTNARACSIETTGTGTSAPEEAGHVATTVMAVAGAGTVMTPVGTAATLETPTAVTGWIGVTGTTSAVHAIVHRTTSRQGLVTGMPVVVAGTTGTGVVIGAGPAAGTTGATTTVPGTATSGATLGMTGASVATGTGTMSSLATSVAAMSVGGMIATVIAGIVTTAVVGAPTAPGQDGVTGTTGMPMAPTPTPWSGRPPILVSSTPRR